MSEASQTPSYQIRDCESFADFAACMEMQRVVWQFSDLDITPLRSFVISRRSGGFTLGAFSENARLLGFAHALPAFDERRRAYYYSHMLAVDPELQNAGIGLRLKLAQRRRALETGVSLLGWTFDPLQSRNAYLNLVKLGGVVRRYHVNYYGNESTSVLHRGLDTDRLFVEWWVGSDHAARLIGGERRAGAPAAAVEVPREIDAIKQADLDEARRWQERVRAAFTAHLAAGLYCAGFEPGREGGPSRYLFYPDEKAEIPPDYR
jgi:predicted GNAT superfamily acetyltransferase